jgi:hypothetical protein
LNSHSIKMEKYSNKTPHQTLLNYHENKAHLKSTNSLLNQLYKAHLLNPSKNSSILYSHIQNYFNLKIPQPTKFNLHLDLIFCFIIFYLKKKKKKIFFYKLFFKNSIILIKIFIFLTWNSYIINKRKIFPFTIIVLKF